MGTDLGGRPGSRAESTSGPKYVHSACLRGRSRGCCLPHLRSHGAGSGLCPVRLQHQISDSQYFCFFHKESPLGTETALRTQGLTSRETFVNRRWIGAHSLVSRARVVSAALTSQQGTHTDHNPHACLCCPDPSFN